MDFNDNVRHAIENSANPRREAPARCVCVSPARYPYKQNQQQRPRCRPHARYTRCTAWGLWMGLGLGSLAGDDCSPLLLSSTASAMLSVPSDNKESPRQLSLIMRCPSVMRMRRARRQMAKARSALYAAGNSSTSAWKSSRFSTCGLARRRVTAAPYPVAKMHHDQARGESKARSRSPRLRQAIHVLRWVRRAPLLWRGCARARGDK